MNKISINSYTNKFYSKNIDECTNEEIYYTILNIIKEVSSEYKKNESKKKIYYISAEFLIGKLLSNNLINLGLFDDFSNELKSYNKNLAEIEDVENEPSLANGGLGRLAACFIDSMSTLGINGEGVGLNYHLGLFKQKFENNLQKEYPNEWITENSWLNKTDKTFLVEFNNLSVYSRKYEIDVLGYMKTTKNKLVLFDLDTVDENIITKGIDFDKTDIKRNLTLFLYPDDSDKKGELLRIYQQYFMVSSAAQHILEEASLKGTNYYDLDEYVRIQINDTHPSLVIPELIRLLMKKGLKFEETMKIVEKVCCYTNHTILSEALEKWPLSYLEEVLNNDMIDIIKRLDKFIKEKYNDKKVHIIDDLDRVHMANMDIHFSRSTNGVAKLHTDILKEKELNHFYKIYKDKFNNKTNGITFRRWLVYANRDLTKYLEELIGKEFLNDSTKLENLLKYIDDKKVYEKLDEIKLKNKLILKDHLKLKGIDLNENSIIDTQIKRIHEYKRQQMNLLYVIYKYLEIKKGNKPKRPITVLLAGKAAPAYIIAKDIIHLGLCLENIINNDEEVNKYLKIHIVENYNVTEAEKLIPATDISEQISLASKEASGTGNMKFMLNGALTLGTLDGANVEISELVGMDNIYIFGEKSENIIKLYETSGYNSKKYYEKENIKYIVDFIVSDEMKKVGNEENLNRLYNDIINKDWFMALIDLEEYINVRNKVYEDYENREKWNKMVINNIAKAGFFSSDRTIEEYNNEIWDVKC